MGLFGEKKKKTKKAVEAKPTTAAESIPYLHVYEDGLIEVAEGRFSKSYILPDINFVTKREGDQGNLAQSFADFVGSFDDTTDVQITLYNRTVNMNVFRNQVLLQMKEDDLNDKREEYNAMLVEKMRGAKNNLETLKILTLTISAQDIVEALEKFGNIDKTVADSITIITKAPPTPLSLIDRLDILNEIYNQGDAFSLKSKRVIDGKTVEAFSLENCVQRGMTTKSVIAPSSIDVKNKQIILNEKTIVKSYYISSYPTWVKGDIFTSFAHMPANMLVSMYMRAMNRQDAVALVKRQGTNITADIIEVQKRAARSGYGINIIPPTLEDAKQETDYLIDSMTKDNARLLLTSFVITIFADSEEELKNHEESLKMIASKALVDIKPMNMQQETGFASALPIGNNKLLFETLMTNVSIQSFTPFDVKDIRDKGGMYYGVNAASHNLILINRTDAINSNAVILGMPGSGKSFAAKREIINVLLNTDDEVYVIDPEREYTALAEELGGAVIKIANGAESYINPFDLNINNADDAGDPVKIKTDFIETICEIMIGDRMGLSPIDKSIIGRSVINIYEPYVRYLKIQRKTFDQSRVPTLVDFYNDLRKQTDGSAMNMTLALERYVRGAHDIFSHRTNVDITNRFTVYDIKDIGPGLKELGLQVCLDNIWNKMIENYYANKRTWFYIDEFYLMMQKPSSSDYISQIWKRARKWNGVPCAITQNVEDMLKSEEARAIINNSPFVIMLGQSAINKQQLSNMFGMSPEEEKYISSIKPGMGLIKVGENLIPMDDNFPKDNSLYRIMTTKPDERQRV